VRGSYTESGLLVPLLRAVARQDCRAAGADWDGHFLPWSRLLLWLRCLSAGCNYSFCICPSMYGCFLIHRLIYLDCRPFCFFSHPHRLYLFLPYDQLPLGQSLITSCDTTLQNHGFCFTRLLRVRDSIIAWHVSVIFCCPGCLVRRNCSQKRFMRAVA
jgi:hypothetical protein